MFRSGLLDRSKPNITFFGCFILGLSLTSVIILTWALKCMQVHTPPITGLHHQRHRFTFIRKTFLHSINYHRGILCLSCITVEFIQNIRYSHKPWEKIIGTLSTIEFNNSLQWSFMHVNNVVMNVAFGKPCCEDKKTH
jgi:hypothetical protein